MSKSEDKKDLDKALAELQAYIRMGGVNDEMIADVAWEYGVSEHDIKEALKWL